MAEHIDKWPVVNKLIDLENEFQQYKPFHGFEHAMYRKVCEAEIAIGKTSAADVVEVVHGEWRTAYTDKENKTTGVECSECGAFYNLPLFDFGLMYNYCPNCGARMDGAT